MSKKNEVSAVTLTKNNYSEESVNYTYCSTSESDNLQKLETLGARFCPIVWGDKRPQGTGWQKNPLTLSQVDLSKNGLGILLGHSNLMAIDIDNPEGRDRFEQYFGVAPCDYPSVSWSSGKNFAGEYQPEIDHTSNIQILLKLSDTQATQLEGRKVFKNNTLDLRWHGCQSVLPSRSPHPGTGKPYVWHHSPSEYAITDMPADIFERMLVDLSANSAPQPSAPTIPLTYTDAPPLTLFLAKEHRQYIDAGAPQGSRNDAGFRLASDLIGTELRLNYLGIEYTERARDLFDYFCDRCSPSLNGEREVIWKSANKNTPTACLTDEMIVSCHKSWLKRQQVKTGNHGSQDVREKLEDIYQGNSEQNPEKKQRPDPSITAKKLVKLWGGKFTYDKKAETWRKWTGTFWKAETPGGIHSEILSYLNQSDQWIYTSALIKDIEALLTMSSDLITKEWKTPPRSLINFKNGVLDLNTKQLKSHCRDYGFVNCIDRDYCPLEEGNPLEMLAKYAPIFDKWIDFSFRGSKNLKMRYLAMIAGVIRGEFAKAEKFIHIIGDTGTGKGTTLRMMQKIIGTESSRSSKLKQLCGAGNMSLFAIAAMIDSLLTICPDEKNVADNLENLNQLCGKDPVSYRAPYAKVQGEKNYAGTLMVASNHWPYKGDTTGIDRRLFLIHMDRKVKPDVDFEDKLETELGAITSIALSLPLDQVRSIINGNDGSTPFAWELKQQNSSVATWMENYLVIDATIKETHLSELHKNFKTWCEETGETFVISRNFLKTITENLKEVFGYTLTKKHKNTGTTVNGIRLRLPSDLPLSSNLINDDSDDKEPSEDSEDGNISSSPTPKPSRDSVSADSHTGGSEDSEDGNISSSPTQKPYSETVSEGGVTMVKQNAENFLEKLPPIYTDDDILEIISDMCRATDKQTLDLLSDAYCQGNDQIKQRVWAMMTPEQKAKVKEIGKT